MDSSREKECLTPVAAGKQMSQTLKDRLKRCGRYHRSPVQSKRQCATMSRVAEQNAERRDVLVTQCLTREDSLVTGAGDNEGNMASTSSNSCLSADVNETLNSLPSSTVNACMLSEQRRHYKTCTPVNKQTDHPVISKYTQDAVRAKSPSHCSTLLHSSSSAGKRSDNSTSVHLSNASLAEISTLNTIKKHDNKCGVAESHETRLQKELAEKQETLRRLKMVKMYREKNDLTELESLISKWRHVSQEALQDLYDRMPAPKPTLGELLDHMNIDHDFIHYNVQDEEFYR